MGSSSTAVAVPDCIPVSFLRRGCSSSIKNSNFPGISRIEISLSKISSQISLKA